MKEEEKLELEMDYAFKVIHDDFPFDKIRKELEQLSIPAQEISVIMKDIDDIILLNTVEKKLYKSRFKYQKSGIGILFTLIFFLLYLAYNYQLIKIEDFEVGALIFVWLIFSFFLFKKIRRPRGKFMNKNKFKNY